LRRDHEQFVAAGVAIVAIGQGTPAESAAFARDLGLPFPVLADPDRLGYAAYGLVEGSIGQLLGPAAMVAGVRATLRRTKSGRPVGNVRQLGGAFAVNRGGIVRFAKPAAHSGDIATTAELLATITD